MKRDLRRPVMGVCGDVRSCPVRPGVSAASLRMMTTPTSARNQGLSGESGSIKLSAGLQLPEYVVNEFCNLILVKRVAAYRLLTDCSIYQALRRLLHEVKHDGAFAEANIFVADFRRSPAPRLPASIRAANKPRVSTRVDALHSHVVPPHGDLIAYQELRVSRVADLPQSLERQCLLDRRADALAN